MTDKKELKCIACRQPLQEIKLGPITVPTCVNPECPRLGLLTVVHGDLVKRMEASQTCKEETDDKSNRN